MNRHALIGQQDPLAALLDDPRLQFRPRAKVKCPKCGQALGQVVDIAVLADGELHGAVVPGAAIEGFVDDPGARRQRQDPSAVGKVAVSGVDYPDDVLAVAFIEHSTSALLPDEFPFTCRRHGTIPVMVGRLRSALVLARSEDRLVTIRP